MKRDTSYRSSSSHNNPYHSIQEPRLNKSNHYPSPRYYSQNNSFHFTTYTTEPQLTHHKSYNDIHSSNDYSLVTLSTTPSDNNPLNYIPHLYIKKPSITFDTFLYIEDKILSLLTTSKSKNLIQTLHECIELHNNYITSSFYNCENISLLNRNSSLLHLFTYGSKLLMYTNMFYYYVTALKLNGEKNVNENDMINMLLYFHRIYLLMCEYLTYIVVSLQIVNKNEIKVLTLLTKQITYYVKHNNPFKLSIPYLVINELKFYIKHLHSHIDKLIKKYCFYKQTTNINHKELFSIFYTIQTKTLNDIHLFFINNNFQNNSLSNPLHYKSKTQPVPFLPKRNDNKKYTLVLDLDETLIHFNIDNTSLMKGFVEYRPFLHEFLDRVSIIFELIIFTIATQQYADPIIDSIERKKKYFKARLYRDHCILYKGVYVKDVSLLGRELSKVIVIDDRPYNYVLNKENGIAVKPFWGRCYNGKDDCILQNLLFVLYGIIRECYNDVREGIKMYKDDIMEKIVKGVGSYCN